MKSTFKLVALVICFVLLKVSADAQNVFTHLKWKLMPQSDAFTATQVSTAGFHTDNWIDAVVPGTVFYSYVVAGKESNPDYADNIYKVDKAKYNKPYWYRTEFSGKGLPAGKRMWLNFNGVNKRAEAYFNGSHIGTIKGLMQRGKYDITDLINKKGSNTIAVLIVPPNTDHGLANRESPTYLSSGSWDWMPAVPGLNSGITDTVAVTTTGPVTIEDPWIHTELPDKHLANLIVTLN
jgi:hypothetical protein